MGLTRVAPCSDCVERNGFAVLEGVHGLLLSGTMVESGGQAELQHSAQPFRGRRSEGLEGDCQVGAELQADVQDGAGAAHVFLRRLPGLGIGDILVSQAGQRHGVLQGVAEAEAFQVLLQAAADFRHFGQHCLVGFGEDSARRDLASEVFVCEHYSAIYEVAEDGHQFAVVAGLEFLPGEVVVLGFGGVCGEHVAHHVCLAREVLQILVSPHRPVAGGGDLVAFEVQELVGRNVVREYVSAVSLEHRREHYAVEHYIVLADEVHQAGVIGLPPFLPTVGEEFLGVGDVAYGGVEPNVEHLAFGSRHRNGHAPVEVAAHGTGLQAAHKPALALAVNGAAPFLVTVQYPAVQPLFVIVQRQIPVAGLLLYRGGSGELGMRVDEFFGTQGAAAVLALVAVCTFVAAAGAFAGDVAVGKEGLCLGIVVLLALLGDELALFPEFAEEIRRSLCVYLRTGAGIDVEVNSQPHEGVLDYLVIAVHYVLGRAAFRTCLYCDGHSVLVASADEEDVFPAHAEIPHVDVRRHVNACKVADVYRSVGIRKRTGYQSAREFFVLTHYCRITFS